MKTVKIGHQTRPDKPTTPVVVKDLDKVGDGTAIRAADTAPAPPKKWGSVKLGRAIATVAF